MTAPDSLATNGPAKGVVAVAGEALVDLVPAPVGGYFEIAPGGSPANVALGLARLGVPARLLARIADDMLGKRIRDHLTRQRGGAGPRSRGDRADLAGDGRGRPDGGATYDFRVDGTADWQWTAAEVDGALDDPGRWSRCTPARWR